MREANSRSWFVCCTPEQVFVVRAAKSLKMWRDVKQITCAAVVTLENRYVLLAAKICKIQAKNAKNWTPKYFSHRTWRTGVCVCVECGGGGWGGGAGGVTFYANLRYLRMETPSVIKTSLKLRPLKTNHDLRSLLGTSQPKTSVKDCERPVVHLYIHCTAQV